MSAAKLGDSSLAVQISSGGYAIEQNFVLNGPVLISVGGVAASGTNPDVQPMLQVQVRKLNSAQSRP